VLETSVSVRRATILGLGCMLSAEEGMDSCELKIHALRFSKDALVIYAVDSAGP
jgi:hypothetical protein